jgi:hypothetical protein
VTVATEHTCAAASSTVLYRNIIVRPLAIRKCSKLHAAGLLTCAIGSASLIAVIIASRVAPLILLLCSAAARYLLGSCTAAAELPSAAAAAAAASRLRTSSRRQPARAFSIAATLSLCAAHADCSPSQAAMRFPLSAPDSSAAAY